MSTDIMMVILTAVYVVATILICYFNLLSTREMKKSREEEARYQEEEKTYRITPWLVLNIDEFACVVEKDDVSDMDFINVSLIDLADNDANSSQIQTFLMKYTVKNIGEGTAIRLTYNWNCRKATLLPLPPPLSFNKPLMRGESYSRTAFIRFSIPEDQFEPVCEDATPSILIHSNIEFETKDIHMGTHSQNIDIVFFLYTHNQEPGEADVYA